jgi:hypothetical protein
MDDIKKILEQKTNKKPPAYEWQDLALNIIKELSIPEFKRSSVFKMCKEKNQTIIRQALNDTKELCQTGQNGNIFLRYLVLITKNNN